MRKRLMALLVVVMTAMLLVSPVYGKGNGNPRDGEPPGWSQVSKGGGGSK